MSNLPRKPRDKPRELTEEEKFVLQLKADVTSYLSLPKAAYYGHSKLIEAAIEQIVSQQQALANAPNLLGKMSAPAGSPTNAGGQGQMSAIDAIEPESGLTPLLIAARNGHLPCVQLLIEKGHAHLMPFYPGSPFSAPPQAGPSAGANSNPLQMKTSFSPGAQLTVLHQAARNDHLEIVQYLLEKAKTLPIPVSLKASLPGGVVSSSYINALVNAEDDSGNTAVHYCAKMGNLKCLESICLAAISSNPSAQNANPAGRTKYVILDRPNLASRTPFLLAASNGQIAILDWILKLELEKSSPTIPSAQATAQQLLPSKLLINTVDINGDTALHLAARCGHLRAVEMILSPIFASLSIDISIKNSRGETPADSAATEAIRRVFNSHAHVAHA